MAPSSSEAGAGPTVVAGVPLVRPLDRIAVGGIALGFLLVFQPWWVLLRAGFFVTLVSTILHVVTSHLEIPPARRRGGGPEAPRDGAGPGADAGVT